MKTTPFAAEDNSPSGVSIEIRDCGADFYADGTLNAWQDGNGMFNRCEASGDLRCYVPVSDVRAAIEAAEKELGVTFKVGAIIPGRANALRMDRGPNKESAKFPNAEP